MELKTAKQFSKPNILTQSKDMLIWHDTWVLDVVIGRYLKSLFSFIGVTYFCTDRNESEHCCLEQTAISNLSPSIPGSICWDACWDGMCSVNCVCCMFTAMALVESYDTTQASTAWNVWFTVLVSNCVLVHFIHSETSNGCQFFSQPPRSVIRLHMGVSDRSKKLN